MRIAPVYPAFIYLCCFVFTCLRVNAQVPTADELFDVKNYIQAIEEYKKTEKQFPEDEELKHRMGICYLNIYSDKSQAIPYLEFCYKKGKYKNEVLLELAMAYQFAYRFEDAISFYGKYKEKAGSKALVLVDHYISTCENAMALMKKPVNISFENAGKEINTKYADYYPFVTKDEGTLFFTSRREQNTGRMRSFNGYFTSDVYMAKVEKGQWVKAKNLGPPLNTSEDEECVGISPDGKFMVFYVDNANYPGDLFHTEVVKGKSFNRPVPFEPPVKTDQLESEGCYAGDANTLYFASARKGGQGETDLYVTKRLPNGEWGIPQNLGATINTSYKEAFPVVSEDGKTMYFSSQGHTSMGGYDIFRSKWNEATQSWGPPVNVGYPLNTTDDDMMFSVAGKGRHGYISAWRKEGFGDLDIYKITFNEADQPLTAITGLVQASDSSKKEIEAYISISEIATKKELDGKDVNPKTGKYIFIVEPGKYLVNITAKGFKPFSEEITIYDKSDFVSELEKNYLLQPEQLSVKPEIKK
jgi:hypothetical protein